MWQSCAAPTPSRVRASPSLQEVPSQPSLPPSAWLQGICFLSWQFIGISYEWNCPVCNLWGLAFFHEARSSQVNVCMYIWVAYAFLLLSTTLLYRYGTIHLSIHCLVDVVHLGCFQVEQTSNKVAVNICTQVLLWADVSLSLVWIQHRGGIARLRISVCLTS